MGTPGQFLEIAAPELFLNLHDGHIAFETEEAGIHLLLDGSP